MSSDLQCARCGAPLAMPSDFGVWLARCQYCGFEHELPDRPQRQAYAERRSQEASQAAQAQAQALAAASARKRSARTGLVVGLVIAAVGLAFAAVIGVTVYNAATQSLGSSALVPGLAPPPTLAALASKATAAGCPKVLDGPSAQSSEYKGTFTIVKRECMRFLAVSTPPAPLTLQVTNAAGAVTTRSAPAGTLDETFCAHENAEHLVKITGGPQFWVQALSCPRTFASDANTTGMTRVSERLKHLMSHGCYEISLAAATFSDERKLTTPLETGTCFDVLAATGVPDNLIQAKVTTPFGEDIAPLPAPTTDLEIPYCAAVAGPHVVELSPAIDGPFSIAIAICNRSALPKVLPKASK
ncbi:MAG TPA: hypothetical protein VNW92_09315 [Polyangiaceae bacterium]|jgi:hypothetical protein|nr:hypothetical protein [Polyangiaceae bacterium]